MMVADTSAFIAIVTNEPEREAFESVMAQDAMFSCLQLVRSSF